MSTRAISRISITATGILLSAVCYDQPLAVDVPLEGNRAPEERAPATRQSGGAGNEVVRYTTSDSPTPCATSTTRTRCWCGSKPANEARPDPTLFRGRGSDVSVVGVPASAAAGARRGDLRVNRTLANAGKTAVGDLLALHGASATWVARALPVMAVRLPDDGLGAALAALFGHDNVDWIEANQRRAAKPTAGPAGNNPVGSNHLTHFVEGAWDHTRGAGAKLGILDSGMAGHAASSIYHPDLRENRAGGGVFPLGFVDDGGDCDADEQADGLCLAYDDQGHGTLMADLTGANDNSLAADDGVGIAPSASIYSMKIAFNADRPGLTCGLLPFGDDTICLEDDDLVAGIDWAAHNGVDVLSMSFVTNPSTSVTAALSYAYNNDDVLLLAGLGNDAADPDGLVASGTLAGRVERGGRPRRSCCSPESRHAGFLTTVPAPG